MKFLEKLNIIEKEQFKFNNFKEAINWLEDNIKSKENLKRVGIMIDIDGVLVKFFQKKIPFGNLKLLLKLAKQENNKVLLVTNRFPYLTKYFPFWDKKTQQMFKNYGIDTETLIKLFAGKNLSTLLEIIKDREVVYYIGSGILDKKLVADLRKKMKEQNIPQEKLIFILV